MPIWLPATTGSPKAPRGGPSRKTPIRSRPWPPRSKSSTPPARKKRPATAYQSLEPLARCADRDLPVFRRLEGVVSRWKAEGSWTGSALDQPSTSGTDETAIDRIDLKTLGPLVWSPFAAEPLSGTDTAGRPWALADHKGKNVLVIFFLGGKCAHCMQQLETFGKEFEALKKAERRDGRRQYRRRATPPGPSRTTRTGSSSPCRSCADPRLELFKRYRAYDDFESQPLHGTFLIDAEGNVRFQRISADPFLDVEFIKTEAARVNRIVGGSIEGLPKLRPSP